MLYTKIKLQPLSFVPEMVTSENHTGKYLSMWIFSKCFRRDSENAGVLRYKLLLQTLKSRVLPCNLNLVKIFEKDVFVWLRGKLRLDKTSLSLRDCLKPNLSE